MFENLYPDEYLDSVFDVDFETYRANRISGVILDIDNTLVPHGGEATKEIIELFERIHNLGMNTCLLSNNKEQRVKPFAEAVNSKYICKAHKPCIKNYIQALKLCGTNPYTSIFIGDQIFTDVWGAKKIKTRTIMVKPVDKKEEFQIVLKRIPEKFILWMWRQSKKRVKKVKKKRY